MVIWEQLVDRNFCLHIGAAVETLHLSVDMQEGGALGQTPVPLSFWQFLVHIMVRLSLPYVQSFIKA